MQEIMQSFAGSHEPTENEVRIRMQSLDAGGRHLERSEEAAS